MGVLDNLPGFFWAGDKNDPRANQELRQRIALQMMGQGRNKGYPKNFGEGLTAIGDSLGEIGMARRLEQADLAQQNAAREIPVGPVDRVVAPPSAQRSSIYSPPPEQGEAPIQPAVTAAPLPTATATAPPVVPPPVTAPPATTLPPPSTAPTTFDDRFGASRPSSVAPAASPRAALDPRSRMAALLQARGGPMPNPTLAAANAPQGGGLSSDRTAIMATNPGASSITLAPQPAPIRPEPVRVAQATNPYDMNEPTPPPRLRMGPDEIRLRTLARENVNNPYAIQRLADPIKALEDARNAEDTRRAEEYRAKLQLYNQLKIKGLDYRADTPKRELEIEQARLNVQKGREPTVRQDVETGHIYNPDTKEYEQPRITGAGDRPPAFKGSEFQGKALVNYGRARLAHDALTPENEELLAGSPMQAALGSVGVRALQDEDYKNADIARENFVQAFIRQQSGAGYGEKELEAEARGMLPKYGDPPKVLEQKRAQREAFVSNMYNVIGPSGQKLVDRGIAIEKEKAAQTKQKPIEIKENDTATGPNGEKIIRRNGKWERM